MKTKDLVDYVENLPQILEEDDNLKAELREEIIQRLQELDKLRGLDERAGRIKSDKVWEELKFIDKLISNRNQAMEEESENYIIENDMKEEIVILQSIRKLLQS